MSDTVTQGIRIVVRPQYVPEQSQPERAHFFFAYHITIRNEGSVTAQLQSRHWIITDGEGRSEEVRGPGVVGQQPRLAPGEQFQYTSACPLTTPVGTMHGSFHMVPEDGEPFEALISPFRLAVPRILN
ncbi:MULTISPECIES: Co2+/Mg2+ efflux protein ApaG [Hydrocarboniphaga]|jgi:ApaG protein|uniref:Protein ApaG n=1 Tax=Hydrocarboniphaga effusa AP103 TaxID=1172194 RepID=I8I5M6_9GAMM|nr:MULTISPECIES: Co2+/Mg2+ efflux protein ApaG [Hydrocarboniphaga]EIT71821.1 ApaG [Hydrocarboniphaga effusa AP103]MDZ4080441.1 Co2+/Mg2+ efflux protein ApaG [Hydrocarboniphaga sp.]